MSYNLVRSIRLSNRFVNSLAQSLSDHEMPTIKNTPRTQGHLNKLGKLILQGKVTDDTKLIKDPATYDPFVNNDGDLES